MRSWQVLPSKPAAAAILCRGMPANVYDDGVMERTVIIEFESVEKALATHESPAYKAALVALKGGVVRDMRIVPGVKTGGHRRPAT